MKIADVAVIIPAFNSELTIKNALKSVMAQTLKPREIILVDDGSRDRTVEVAKSIKSNAENIKFIIICQKNAGPGAARNRAIIASTSTFLAFLDADDDWLPLHLEKSLKKLEEDNYVMSVHNEWLVREGKETLNDSVSRLYERKSAFLSLYCKGCISTSTVVVTRESVFLNGGFDPSLSNGQDVDLWLSILSDDTVRVAAFSESLSRYYITSDGINSHTAQRLKYYILIANRWAATVAGKDGGGLKLLWFRVIAIHFEAVRSYLQKGLYIKAIFTVICSPFHMFDILVRAIFQKPFERPSFL